ncbi:hypothetical protein AB0D22_07790 [Kitasatospora sp. NPDC048538]|uniref:hypothetical protein n=1 Tax=Kitasatospora sp. NPDC048538 TaxID=3155633 RepID=UPI0033F3DEBD
MSLITALSHSQPDDGESSRVAAWAVRRLSDSLVDSALPSDIARPLVLLEPLLHEVEEALRLAAETTSSASTSPAARAAAEQLGQASATTVLLRLHLEQITTRLHGYGTDFPADNAGLSPRAAAAQRTVPETGVAPRSTRPAAASAGVPTATAGATVRR